MATTPTPREGDHGIVTSPSGHTSPSTTITTTAATVTTVTTPVTGDTSIVNRLAALERAIGLRHPPPTPSTTATTASKSYHRCMSRATLIRAHPKPAAMPLLLSPTPPTRNYPPHIYLHCCCFMPSHFASAAHAAAAFDILLLLLHTSHAPAATCIPAVTFSLPLNFCTLLPGPRTLHSRICTHPHTRRRMHTHTHTHTDLCTY